MNLKEPRVNDSGVVGCHGELQFHFIPDVSKGLPPGRTYGLCTRYVSSKRQESIILLRGVTTQKITLTMKAAKNLIS